VDVAVIAFDGNHFNGDVAPALLELQESGTVRILDLTFIHKDGAGAVSAIEVADSEVAAAFEQVAQDEFDLLSDEDLESIAANLPLNTSALLLAWENTWAARLAGALRDSHGQVVLLERIPREAVVRAINDLDQEG
jgi:hypothetical protein